MFPKSFFQEGVIPPNLRPPPFRHVPSGTKLLTDCCGNIILFKVEGKSPQLENRWVILRSDPP